MIFSTHFNYIIVHTFFRVNNSYFLINVDTPWSIYLSRFYVIKTLYWWWSNHKFYWRKSMRICLLYHQLTFKVNRKFSLFTTSYYFKCNINTSINTLYFSIPSFPNKEPVFSGINTGSLLSFSIELMSCKFLWRDQIKPWIPTIWHMVRVINF